MELRNDFIPGKFQASNCSQPKPIARKRLFVPQLYQLANQTQAKKEKGPRRQRPAHRPAAPTLNQPKPAHDRLFFSSSLRPPPQGGVTSALGARRTPHFRPKFLAVLSPSQQPSHGRPLSFLSSSIVTPVVSVHALSGLVNGHCDAVLQVTNAHAAKLFTCVASSSFCAHAPSLAHAPHLQEHNEAFKSTGDLR